MRIQIYVIIIASFLLLSPDNCAARKPDWGNAIKQGNNCMHSDDYDCAISNFQKALKRIPRNSNKPAAQCYYGLGKAYKAQAKYDIAMENFQKALDLAEGGNDKQLAGRLLMHMAEICGKWGDHKNVLKHLKKAATALENSSDTKTLSVLNVSTAISYLKTSQFDLAEEHMLKAVEYAQQGTSIKIQATSWNKLGNVYLRNRKPEQALEAFSKALEINEKLGNESIVAQGLNDIAKIYIEGKELQKAETLLKRALQINRELGRDKNMADNLHLLGVAAYDRNNNREAIEYLTQAVETKNKLRETAQGRARRTYLASQINSYNRLIDAYSAEKEASGFFRTFEMSRARQLAETIGRDGVAEDTELSGFQQIIPADTAVLIYSVTGKNRLRMLAVTAKNAGVKRLRFQEFAAAVNKAAPIMTAELKTVAENERGFKSSVRKKLKELQPIRDISEAITRYRTFLSDPADNYEKDRLHLSGELYKMLIESANDIITGKKRLIIIPDGPLALIPFETLLSGKGAFLIQQYAVGYVQSAGVYRLLASRKKNDRELSIVALGDAEYEKAYPRPDLPKGICEQETLEEAIDQAIGKDSSLAFAYSCLEYDSFGNLPGTGEEIRRIGSIFKKADLISGRDVNEKTIREMARSGKLKKAGVLHFAVHGIALPTYPELSALVLTRNGDNGAEEGYLNAAEIRDLEIGARFVNLSACETGLGALVKGEGVVGLTHAFLAAGAGGMSVSLWNVADDSAVEFMTDMYRKAVAGQNFDEAMSQTKRDFINGRFGQRFKKPYYWAPFVYYGE
ncbi:CHAT domain-containing protein [Maridesulfovibrio sp. FT414]|uniref:CHAT domain-containing protein n=1 Tax=Maridesulfovibrio sp. FT414 TaxID=2979469 RepID=UPI003D80053F